MVLTTSIDKMCVHHQAFINGVTQLQPENLHYLREAKNILARKKIIKSNLIVKLKKKMMQQLHATHCQKAYRKPLTTTPVLLPTNTIANTCYSYQQDVNYPITMNDWNPLPTPLLNICPVLFTTGINPLIGTIGQPIFTPIMPQTFVPDVANLSNYSNEVSYSAEQIEEVTTVLNEQTYYVQEEVTAQTDTSIMNTDVNEAGTEVQIIEGDPLETYLKLPKELFPSPKMLAVDPNPIIDEICKLSNLQHHVPWILDLEFGVPKSPITRPIPAYNVKFNSIHCKNALDAIHPSFETCDPDFKRALLFYYDCVVSAWYKGYMIMNYDRSVENFQSWLLLPMQVLGMAWS